MYYFSCFYIILIIFLFNGYMTQEMGPTPTWPPSLLAPGQSSLGALILTQHTCCVADTKECHDATGSPCHAGDCLQSTTYPPNRQAQALPARPTTHLEYLPDEGHLAVKDQSPLSPRLDLIPRRRDSVLSGSRSAVKLFRLVLSRWSLSLRCFSNRL